MNLTKTPSTFERLVFPVFTILVIVLLKLVPELISPSAQLISLAILVACFGLPHGALDPWIAEVIGIRQTPGQNFIFILVYIAIAGMVIVTWVLAPVISLLSFLAISVWHFSDDWKFYMVRPLRLCMGLLLLLMPIGFHTENVGVIFAHLSGERGVDIANTLALPAGLLVSGMALLIGCALWARQWLLALEYFALLSLAYLTPPLIYFIFYFCLLHSPRHLMSLFREASSTEYPRLLRMIFTYSLATFLLLGLLFWLWSDLSFDSMILRLVFIGLAAVTVPHMVLIAIAHFHKQHIAGWTRN